MTHFPILNEANEEVGRVEEIVGRVPPVSIVIDDMEFTSVSSFLNTAIADGREIVGTNGIRQRIHTLINPDEAVTLFLKIESLSTGRLHVGQARADAALTN